MQFPNQGNFENILTLGVTVDPRIKAKIWAGQYVELASLHSVIDQRPLLAVAWEGNQAPLQSLLHATRLHRTPQSGNDCF